MKALFNVSIAGVNITDRLNPYLVSIRVTLTDGGYEDRASVELADDNGQLMMPPRGDSVSIALGWEGYGPGLVFEGYVDAAHSMGGRDGRFLYLECTAGDWGGSLIKEPQEDYADDTDLESAAGQFAERAGLSLSIHPDLAKITRPWWGISNESFVAWGARMADELGAIFKVVGQRAVMVPRIGESASGQAMGNINAVAGDNLIYWDIVPMTGRPSFAQFGGRFFDPVKAAWNAVSVSPVGPALGSALGLRKFAAADQTEAEEGAFGSAMNAYDAAGYGQVIITGSPLPQVGATVTVVGARQGIDGTYRIDGVEHRFSRTDGFQTVLTIGQPGGGGFWEEGGDEFDPNTGAEPGYTGGGPTSGPAVEGPGYSGGGPTSGPAIPPLSATEG